MRPKNLHKKLDIPNFSLWSLEKSPLFHVPHYEVYKDRSFLQVVFKQFNSLVQGIESLGLQNTKYRFLAADSSTCTYFSTPLFSSQDYYYSPEHSIKGIYSMHMRFCRHKKEPDAADSFLENTYEILPRILYLIFALFLSRPHRQDCPHLLW